MDDNPESHLPREPKEPKEKTLEAISRGTKRQSASTHSQSGRTQKAHKANPDSTPPPVFPRAGEATEDVGTPFHKTPASKRMASHSGLIERGNIVYVSNMETQIRAEARGVTKKNVPWDTFRSIYLCNFKTANAKPGLTVNSVKRIGEGAWEEQQFWERLREVLSNKVLYDLKLFYSDTTTSSKDGNGKEVPSQPAFILHVGEESPSWADVELLFEHTRSPQEVVTNKFSQWLRGAWSVFHHQPFRRHFYGIMFLKPCAYICYADHGCAAYSEPLNFVRNAQHTQFLLDFLSGFILEPEHRGRDLTIKKVDHRVHIQHAGKTWAELPEGLLWYRPCLIGRHIRVAWTEPQGTNSPEPRVVMKSTWEEKLPPESSPPPEVEILKILLKANVRGLPQPYELESAIVRDKSNLEVKTRSLPKDCKVALPALTDKLMSNEPLEVHRRLIRIILSYCRPLKDAMRNATPKLLMQSIRDSMIVYYEAYKLPESGFIHGDISIENILVPIDSSKLTGGLTSEDRRGTLIDWNLCFTADGTSSRRTFSSGTTAFMAPILLEDKSITRRTLVHDMESYFTVILWIASFDYEDSAAFQTKPLARMLLDKKKAPEDIVNAKYRWFAKTGSFQMLIIDHFQPFYRGDESFLNCLQNLRRILYPEGDEDISKQVEDADDPMKVGLFRKCMEEIDNYLCEKKGCDEMRWIDSHSLAPRNAESVGTSDAESVEHGTSDTESAGHGTSDAKSVGHGISVAD